MRRPFVRWAGVPAAAAACIALLVPSAAGAGPAQPVFGLRPALFGQTTLAHDHFVYSLPAGGTVVDAVDAVNFTAGPLNLQLYRANLNPVRGGGLAPGQVADRPSGATPWLRLSQEDLVIAPRGESRDVFRLSIPRFTPPGQYLSAIVATRTGGPSSDEGLTLQSRVALMVEVDVIGKLRPGLAVGAIKGTRSGDHEVLTLDVHNTGNALLTLKGAVTVRSGNSPRVVQLGPPDLYVIPGGTAHLSGTWRQLPFVGPAHLSASVTALVAGSPVGSYRSPGLDLWFVPWLDTGLLAGAVLGVGATLFLTRSRRAAWLARRAEERQVVREFRARRAGG